MSILRFLFFVSIKNLIKNMGPYISLPRAGIHQNKETKKALHST